MYRVSILYGRPTDVEHFRAYYRATHLPLVRQMPGVQAMRYGFDVSVLEEGEAPFFAIFEADFNSADDMFAALASPQGQAAAGDVANYATGGAKIIHYPLIEGGPA